MKFYITILTIAVSAFAAACGGGANVTVNTSNTARNGTNTTAANQSNSTDGVRRPDAPTTNNAPTLTPVVHAFYDALKAKDDAALKNVLAAKEIQSVLADMKEENRTDIAAFLAEFETLPETPVQVRNEQINGNKAVAEVLGGTYPNWTPLGFVLEDGKWKLSGESPDIEKMKPAAAPVN